MHEFRENIIVQKPYSFALKMVTLDKELPEQREYVLSKQLLRNGTSIGANIHEPVASESKKDFLHKMGMALKEARETSYWLNLLKDSSYIGFETFNSLHSDCQSMIRILNSIILTTKDRYFPNIHDA